MRVRLTWDETLSGHPNMFVHREVDAELGDEFFEKIADAIEARARKFVIYERDPFDGRPAPVDTTIVRVTMGVIAGVFRDITKAERAHEAMADIAARERRRVDSPCPPGMFCIHEPRCPGAANKDR